MDPRSVPKVVDAIARGAAVSRRVPGRAVAPDLGDTGSSLITLPRIAKVGSDSTIGTNWTTIVSGRWSTSPYNGLLLFDRSAGAIELWDTDGTGKRATLLKRTTGLDTTCTHIAAGIWSPAPETGVGGGSAYSGIVMYSQSLGRITFYNTDGAGNLCEVYTRATNDNWTHVVPGWFLDSPYMSLLMYAQSTGTTGYAELWQFDDSTRITVCQSYTYFRPTWTHIVGGLFGQFGAEDCWDIFFYEASTGDGELLATDGVGGLMSVATADLPTNVTSVVAGNWGDGSVGLVFHNGDGNPAGNLSFRVVAIDPATNLPYVLEIPHSTSGIRPAAGTLIAGSFYLPEPEDHCFDDGPLAPTVVAQEKQRLLDLRSARAQMGSFKSLLAYDQSAGVAETFLNAPEPQTLDPIEGYAISTSEHPGQSARPTGSLLPGETIYFNIGMTAGASFTVRIFRGDTDPSPIALGTFTSGGPFDRTRTLYRDGVPSPALSTLPHYQIATSDPSGLYFARVEVMRRRTPPGGRFVGELERSIHEQLDIPFVVRAPANQRNKILVVIPDATFEAYNIWGGRSLYGYAIGDDPDWAAYVSTPSGTGPWAFKVSFRRHFRPMYPELQAFDPEADPSALAISTPFVHRWHYRIWHFVQWAAREGLNLDFCTSRDLDSEVPASSYAAVVFPGHHEYWSTQMRLNLQSYQAGGGNAVFLSGNVIWFQVRFDYVNDQLICYKYPNFDPLFGTSQQFLSTGHWQDAPVSWPSYSATGVNWSGEVYGYEACESYHPCDGAKDHWALAQSLALMTDGGGGPAFGKFVGSVSERSVIGDGAETDQCDATASPAGFTRLAIAGRQPEASYTEPFMCAPADHDTCTMGIFSPNGNNATFTASSTNWTLGLSRQMSSWNAMDQITLNALTGLGTPLQVAPAASDVGVGGTSAWKLGPESVGSDGFAAHVWNGSTWGPPSLIGARRIAVDPGGAPWIVNTTGGISRLVADSWTSMPGLGRDIGIGANGDVWLIGTNAIGPSDYGIYKWDGAAWQSVDGGAVRISVTGTGEPWVINSAGGIYHRPGGYTGSWQFMVNPSDFTPHDVAGDPDGTAWISGWLATERRLAIYRYVNGQWARAPGVATALAAGPSGLWIVAPRSAGASSVYPGFPASAAIDGDSTTRWSSLSSDPQWISVDLGVSSYIKGVTLTWETAYGKAYQIEVSPNGTNWTTVYSTFSGVGGTETIALPMGTKGRYVRMFGIQRGTGYGYSLWDFRVDCFPQ